jgi:hypothetical protein
MRTIPHNIIIARYVGCSNDESCIQLKRDIPGLIKELNFNDPSMKEMLSKVALIS